MATLDMIEDKNVAPISTDYDPLPPGRYKAEVVKSEIKITKSGGQMLACEWNILDPEYTGRKIWSNFNIVNASEKAQQIGRGQLSALSQACGYVGIPEESESLHNIPHQIKVGIEPNPGYPDRRTIKGFFAIEKKEPVTNGLPKSIAEDKLPNSDLPF